MDAKQCPKCSGLDIKIYSNICETTSNGFAIRLRCNKCGFEPPKSKWQWFSEEKALEIWNKYKRK